MTLCRCEKPAPGRDITVNQKRREQFICANCGGLIDKWTRPDDFDRLLAGAAHEGSEE